MAGKHVGAAYQDPALSPPRNVYRDLIRNVAVSRGRYIRQSAHPGSSYSNSSGASSSYCSSASTSATAEFCTDGDHELSKIARLMVNDGYAWRMVNAFGAGGGPDHARLETWFLELDVDWVLQIHQEHGLQRHFQDNPESSLQELVHKWIRALTVIAVSIKELLTTVVNERPVVAVFGKASMDKMLVFVDAIIPALKLQALLDMYVCVSSVSSNSASFYRFKRWTISREARRILCDIDSSLVREERKIREAISRTMGEVKALVEDDDLWAIDIFRGRGEVHRNTRFMVDCIMPVVKAMGSIPYTKQSHLRRLIDDSVHHLKDLLVSKSEEHIFDPSLRYLFLLNNFYYSVAQLSGPWPWPGDHWVQTPECRKLRDSYLHVSWGHVLSHIRRTDFKDSCLDVSCGPLQFSIPKTPFGGSHQHRTSSSSLIQVGKFESAFHKTYQTQKFWKVPEPQLRNMLREAIVGKVISEYRCYLEKDPELEEYISSRSSSPDALKEMLGELFEG
uniref:Uncharacterized protein n=1 Tax=Avena sativa TaxID=4498 RepID=A0ACD5YUU3_AVESA